MIRQVGLLVIMLVWLTSCQTPIDKETKEIDASIEQWVEPQWQAAPRPSAYDSLPGWDNADLGAGLNALNRSCAKFKTKAPTDFISNRQLWAGQVTDWLPACEALSVIGDRQSARAVIQALFVPMSVTSPGGESRFTGYFEPTYEARLRPEGRFVDPVLAKPSDLVAQNGKVYQRQKNRRLGPYPTREEIMARGGEPLAYMRPEDLFFLQIQGSGRLLLPDGRTIRAVYAANNGRTFVSTANWLLEKGWIERSEAGMTGIKAWMARTSERRMRQAMNANPRYIFFAIKPEGDSSLGPDGSQGVPLTPLGSLAVDPAFHALGTPLFVQTRAPGLGGEWSGFVVAQDTGGAIKGAVRGDIYFGTGTQAGQRADTMNAPGKLWVLLPRAVASRLKADQDIASKNQKLGDHIHLP